MNEPQAPSSPVLSEALPLATHELDSIQRALTLPQPAVALPSPLLAIPNLPVFFPTEAGQRFPLTPRQTLLWMDRKLFPHVPLHHIGLGLRLRGHLDIDRLRSALRYVWQTTDCLRLRMDEAQPEQWFAPVDEVALDLVDLSSPAEERAWRGALTCARFEFGGPLVRAGLGRVTPEEHLLLIVFHHLVADGATAVMLANRLATAYGGPRAVTPASYRRYLEGHAEYRASAAFAEDAGYWSAKLGRGTAPLELYGRPHVDPSLAVAAVRLTDVDARLAGLAELARHDRVALISAGLSQLIAHATLLGAYAHRASGNKEIVVAAPYANRPGLLGQIGGLTMEELFIKLELDDGETFASLAQKVREEVVSTMRHGRYCVSERGLSFVQLNLLTGSLQPMGDLTVELDPREAFLFEEQIAGLESTPRNLFSVSFHQIAGQADRFELGFHAATFPEPWRVRARNHFLRIMDAMLDDLDTPIARVPLVEQDERQLLVSFGQGARPGEPAQDLVARFARWADGQPAATAVATADGDCSYGELRRRVRALAATLVGLGAGPEKTVCVCLPRSLDELVALLAVLEVGAAYVPVDPSHPGERTRLVLEDAHPSVVLTRSELAANFRDIPAILLDRYDWATPPETAPPPAPPARAAQLAYVLFTSGSTGRPKGVEVTRGNLANFLASMAHTPGLTAHDRLLAITTTTFDIAALELFLPLYVGGTVEIVARETATDPRLLRRVLERRHPRITLLQATPATWRMLLDAGFVPDRSLRLLCGGEALPSSLAQKLGARGSQLWNMYGPTETTVWSSLECVPPGARRISVGKPIDRTNLYVMGPGLELEPIGAVGEICIGGAGVARGYRGRPDLTAERFLPDPIRRGDERLYRTGDLGRWLEDGRLECLGRIDHQVKVRGFRVEPGEIEACLSAAPGVTQALVVARPAPSGEASLVAYWTGDAALAAPLAERARTHLPAYMQPAAYVHLTAFPLNTNGKIDRKLLPDPGLAAAPVSLKPAATRMEERLLGLWRTLLGRQDIGVDQSFFDLGGDSILAVTLAAKIADEIGVEMPLSRLLEEPTIERLARSLTPTPRGVPLTSASSLVEIRPGHGRDFFFVHDGDGEALLYRSLALLLPADLAVWGLVPRPERGMQVPHATLTELARHYVDEIKRKQPSGPYRLGGLCAGGIIAFEMARQLEKSGETVSPLVLLDAAAPGTPLRFALAARRRALRVGALIAAACRGEAGGLVRTIRQVVSSTRNTLDYELHGLAYRSLARLRHWLLQWTLREGRAWPAWLGPPSIRETCLELQRGHDAGSLAASTVLLVRANGGDGSEADRPLREQYDDPLLGWGERVCQGVQVLDSPWGHSTMLQNEGARQIAARLASLL